MSNGRPYHKAEYDGKTYKLRLNAWGAFVLDRDNKFRISQIDFEKFDIPEIVYVVYGSLYEYHEKEASPRLAASIVDSMGFIAAAELAGNLIADYVPKAKVDEDESEEEENSDSKNSQDQTPAITGTDS